MCMCAVFGRARMAHSSRAFVLGVDPRWDLCVQPSWLCARTLSPCWVWCCLQRLSKRTGTPCATFSCSNPVPVSCVMSCMYVASVVHGLNNGGNVRCADILCWPMTLASTEHATLRWSPSTVRLRCVTGPGKTTVSHHVWVLGALPKRTIKRCHQAL